MQKHWSWRLWPPTTVQEVLPPTNSYSNFHQIDHVGRTSLPTQNVRKHLHTQHFRIHTKFSPSSLFLCTVLEVLMYEGTHQPLANELTQ